MPYFKSAGETFHFPELSPGMTAEIVSPNGNRLRLTTTDRTVELREPRSPHKGEDRFLFRARITDDRTHAGTEPTLNLKIRTRYPRDTVPPHPDFNPHVLLPETLAFFDANGHPPEMALTSWSNQPGYDTNFRCFVESLPPGSLPETVSEADQRAAARDTWSGRLLLANGFDGPVPDGIRYLDLGASQIVAALWRRIDHVQRPAQTTP